MSHKPRPIWQNLPEHFKIDVAGKLDPKSRLSLQLCSRSDRDTVIRSPMFLQTIGLRNSDTRNHLAFDINYERSHGRWSSTSKTFPILIALQRLLTIIQIPKHFINKLNIDYFAIEEILRYESMFDNFKIHCKTLRLSLISRHVDEEWICETTLRFFKYLKCQRLFLIGSYSEETFNKIVASKFWKNAVAVNIVFPMNFPIDHFLHLNLLNITVEELKSEDAKRLIKVFCSKRSVFHCETSFQISTGAVMDPSDILEDNSYDLKLDLTSEHDRDRHLIKVQKFKMEYYSNLIFVVKACKNLLVGAVCRYPPQLINDFMNTPQV